VTCGIVNTFENQDITIQFSAPVDLLHVLSNPASFKVFESASGISPAGEVLVDPSDATRLIFRPLLSFDSLGVPSFGFAAGASYQIQISGTAQGDPAPYVQSIDGKKNESRLLCSITTDQGLTDPVPGAPVVQIFVDEIDPISGVVRNVEINDMVGQLSETSKITFIFQDVMNLGTVVIPATGTAPKPGITVSLDPDGLSGPLPASELSGTYTFDVDQNLLRTTAIYTPLGGTFPSGGAAGIREVILNIPTSVVDLIGNPVANGGTFSMQPEVKVFPTATLPPGGEQFIDQGNLDIRRSGADWGESQGGRLKPGTGGGSGRLGDLKLNTNESLTLYTSPRAATGFIQFDASDNRPKISDAIVFGDGLGNTVVFGFKKFANITQADKDNNLLPREVFTSYSLSAIANVLNGDDPGYTNIPAWIFNATYSVEGNDTLRIDYKTPGAVGNAFEIVDDFSQGWAGTQIASGRNLTGGFDAHSFGGMGEIGEDQILTNFDFQANPGAEPPPLTVDDGIFEFSYIDLAPGAALTLMGDDVARVFARGQMILQDQSRIDISGSDAAEHHSDGPQGGPGAPGGPGGSPGAQGADRFDNSNDPTGLMTLPTGPPYEAGIVNIDANLAKNGVNALGIGKTPGQDGGRGGSKWPLIFPARTINLGGMATDDINCASEQVGSTGSGGAYSRDGGDGVALAAVPNSISPAVTPNANPTPTTGGDFTKTSLPPAGTLPLERRTLDPDQGFLEGGSGGGGGGTGVTGTVTNVANAPACLDPSVPSATPITSFRSHSGAGGGGAAGALQAQAGRYAQVGGNIVALGGNGGDAAPGAVINGQDAPPGGAGSGGAVLLQSEFVDIAAAPNLLQIDGGRGGLGNLHALGRSLGGDGSPGILRAESIQQSGSFFLDVAQTVDVFDPNVLDQTDPNDPNGVAAVHWLSVGTWTGATTVPGSFSAGQSCWMKPAGNFFTLTFQDDTGGLGWDMDLILDLGMGAGEQLESYRGSTVFGGASPQEVWGELFTENGVPGAPIVVRFQGAQSTGGALVNPCDIDPNTPFSQIKSGSVTPWVRHPSELNVFSPAPDMCRFLILFDASHPEFAFIKGVTNVQIRADPD
jgi:hypothetical protein